VRKYFLVNDENEAGGVYLWESKEAAEKIYAGEWRDKLKARFGAEPKIAYFETPVIADLLKGEVSTD
jgi:hypothetical protein